MRSRAERTLGSFLSGLGLVLDLSMPLFSKQTGNPITYEGEGTDKQGFPYFLFKDQTSQLIKLCPAQISQLLTNEPPSRGLQTLEGFVNVQLKPRSSYKTSTTRQSNGMPFLSLEEAQYAAGYRNLTIYGPVSVCQLTPVRVLS